MLPRVTIIFQGSFFKNLATAQKIELDHFFALKIVFTQGRVSSSIYDVLPVFEDLQSKETKLPV